MSQLRVHGSLCHDSWEEVKACYSLILRRSGWFGRVGELYVVNFVALKKSDRQILLKLFIYVVMGFLVESE